MLKLRRKTSVIRGNVESLWLARCDGRAELAPPEVGREMDISDLISVSVNAAEIGPAAEAIYSRIASNQRP
jgi:hypothetical protein